ncbi:MAG: hypothetical protein HPY70_05445 [Firmicutes bacterium]|nr:hypothetical protein [Bacillota bacterium]
MNSLNIQQEELEGIIHFLISSARGCVDETPLYGPLRLLEAASRLLSIVAAFSDRHLELKKLIDENKYLVLTDEGQFLRELDKIILLLAQNSNK